MEAPVSSVSTSALLSAYVREIAFADGQSTRRVNIRPDGEMDLLLKISLVGDSRQASAYLIGIQTRFRTKHIPEGQRVIAVRFYPGAAICFFPFQPSSLQDCALPLHDLESELLAAALTNEPNQQRQQELVEAFLIGRLMTTRVEEYLMISAAATQLTRVSPKVEEVAHTLGITSRHLHRLFVSCVGLGPKQYAKMCRLARAIDIRRYAPNRSWGHIAQECGYYDQAQMIADFRLSTGMSPSKFFDDSSLRIPSQHIVISTNESTSHKCERMFPSPMGEYVNPREAHRVAVESSV